MMAEVTKMELLQTGGRMSSEQNGTNITLRVLQEDLSLKPQQVLMFLQRKMALITFWKAILLRPKSTQ
jgi:hypothetical protein